MPRIISLLLLGIVVAASVLQIPWLLTISTALFWIYAVLSPISLFHSLSKFEELKKVSIGSFLTSMFFSFITLGVYAYVGWSWTFAWVMLTVFVRVGAAFSNKEVK